MAALENATGKAARIFGKPEPGIFRAVLDDLGLPAASVAMVGDDPETDLAAARAVAMPTILVETGKFRHRQRERDETAETGGADLVVESVADLPGILLPDGPTGGAGGD